MAFKWLTRFMRESAGDHRVRITLAWVPEDFMGGSSQEPDQESHLTVDPKYFPVEMTNW